MARMRKDRVKPSHYPALPFHILRAAQLVSSVIVVGIMAYFMKELRDAGFGMPWTFILLLTTALATLTTLLTTLTLHILFSLNPLLNSLLNAVLLLLWTLAFALLTRFSARPVLSQACSATIWDAEAGVVVCRLYKAVFSFALLGLLGTAASLGLDVYVQKRLTKRGRFVAIGQGMGSGGSNAKSGFEGEHRGLAVEDEGHEDGNANGYGYEDQAVQERNPNPMARATMMAGARNRGAQGQGYAPVEGQVLYDEDTGYRGAAEAVGRRSAEGRM